MAFIALHECLPGYRFYLAKNPDGFFGRLESIDFNPALYKAMPHPPWKSRATPSFSAHLPVSRRIRRSISIENGLSNVPPTKVPPPLHGLTECALFFSSGLQALAMR